MKKIILFILFILMGNVCFCQPPANDTIVRHAIDYSVAKIAFRIAKKTLESETGKPSYTVDTKGFQKIQLAFNSNLITHPISRDSLRRLFQHNHFKRTDSVINVYFPDTIHIENPNYKSLDALLSIWFKDQLMLNDYSDLRDSLKIELLKYFPDKDSKKIKFDTTWTIQIIGTNNDDTQSFISIYVDKKNKIIQSEGKMLKGNNNKAVVIFISIITLLVAVLFLILFFGLGGFSIKKKLIKSTKYDYNLDHFMDQPIGYVFFMGFPKKNGTWNYSQTMNKKSDSLFQFTKSGDNEATYIVVEDGAGLLAGKSYKTYKEVCSDEQSALPVGINSIITEQPGVAVLANGIWKVKDSDRRKNSDHRADIVYKLGKDSGNQAGVIFMPIPSDSGFFPTHLRTFKQDEKSVFKFNIDNSGNLAEVTIVNNDKVTNLFNVNDQKRIHTLFEFDNNVSNVSQITARENGKAKLIGGQWQMTTKIALILTENVNKKPDTVMLTRTQPQHESNTHTSTNRNSRKFYMDLPDGEFFRGYSKSDTKREGISVFEFTQFGTSGEATFSIISDTALKYIKNAGTEKIKSACSFEEEPVQETNSIDTKKTGVAEMQGEDWKIIQKATIVFRNH